TTVRGKLNSQAGHVYRIELFVSAAADATGRGQGRTFLGAVTVTADAAGNAPIVFTTTGLSTGGYVTTTATDLSTGDTSEFSNALKVPADGGLTAATGYGAGSGTGIVARV